MKGRGKEEQDRVQIKRSQEDLVEESREKAGRKDKKVRWEISKGGGRTKIEWR